MDRPLSNTDRYLPKEQTYVANGCNLIYVENDVHGIGERLKEFDSGYFIMFNPEKQKYEVHHNANIGSTYCLTAYRVLDARTVEIVKKSSAARRDVLFREMRENNERVEIRQRRDRENLLEAIAADEIYARHGLGRQYFT